MADFTNFMGTIDTATGTNAVQLVTAPTDKSLGVISCRLALMFPLSESPLYRMEIILSDGTNDLVIRKLPLRNYQASGTYIDIIPQFNLQAIFGLAPGWSLKARMETAMIATHVINFFGIGEVSV